MYASSMDVVRTNCQMSLTYHTIYLFSPNPEGPPETTLPICDHTCGGTPEERAPGNANISEERITTCSWASGLVTTDENYFLVII